MPPSAADALIAPAWLAVNLGLGRSLWRVARGLFPDDAPRQLALHTLTLAWAIVTAVSIAQGAAGQLSRFGPLACVAGIALAIALAHGHREVGRLRSPDSLLEAVTRPRNLAISLVALGLAGHTLADGLTQHVTDWDSLMYHIPLVDQWIQAGSLYAPGCYQWSHPGGNELIGFWVMAPFSGDFFAPLNNLLASAVLLLAALELAEGLGLSRTYARLAAVATVANFVVLQQLIDAGNDVAVAALFLAAVAYAVRYSESRRRADVVLCGVGLGLLSGVKFYALGYAAVAWVAVAGLAFRRLGPIAAARLAAGTAGLAIVFGGYWYARNAAASGSPLYPLGIEAGGVLVERYPSPWRSSFLGCGRPEALALGLRAAWEMAGPCHLAAVVLVPLTIPWLIATGRRPGRDARLALAIGLAGSVAVLLATPFSVEDCPGTLNQLRRGYAPARYGLVPLTLAVLGLSIVLQDLAGLLRSRPTRRATPAWRRVTAGLPAALMGAGVVFQLVFPHGELRIDLAWSALIGLNALGLAFLLRRAGRECRAAALVASGLFASLLAGAVSVNWRGGFYGEYERFSRTGIYSRVGGLGPGPKVCVLDYLCHPFFGPERRVRVCQPSGVPSLEWLLGYLEHQGTDLIALRSEGGNDPEKRDPYSRVRSWLAEDPVRVQLIYSDQSFLLYRILDPGSTRESVGAGDARGASWGGLASRGEFRPLRDSKRATRRGTSPVGGGAGGVPQGFGLGWDLRGLGDPE